MLYLLGMSEESLSSNRSLHKAENYMLCMCDSALLVCTAPSLCKMSLGCGHAGTEGQREGVARQDSHLCLFHSDCPWLTGLSQRRSYSWLCKASSYLCRTRVNALHSWSSELLSICLQPARTKMVP